MTFKPKMGKRRPYGPRRNNNNNVNVRMNGASPDHERGMRFDGRQVRQAATARERYLNMARDALNSGDRVLAENYHQHADHYYRILLEADAVRMPSEGGNGGGEFAPQPQEGGVTEGRASSDIPEFPATNGNNPAYPQPADETYAATE